MDTLNLVNSMPLKFVRLHLLTLLSLLRLSKRFDRVFPQNALGTKVGISLVSLSSTRRRAPRLERASLHS